jgi:hypothetical protein
MAGEGLRRRSGFMILLLLLNGFEATVTISGGDAVGSNADLARRRRRAQRISSTVKLTPTPSKAEFVGLHTRMFTTFALLTNQDAHIRLPQTPPEGWRTMVSPGWAPGTIAEAVPHEFAAWAELSTLLAGDGYGTWFHPEGDDEVLVASRAVTHGARMCSGRSGAQEIGPRWPRGRPRP